jgi:hypothetical protein
VFPGRAATKVGPCHQYRRSTGVGLVELEIGIRRTVWLEAPVEEQEFPEPGAFDSLQELLGDDLVRIDIDPRRASFVSFGASNTMSKKK